MKPYLIRAVYEWLADTGMTPYLLVDAQLPRVDVPWEFVKDGQIVLNVSGTAVQNLQMTNTAITFSARFAGISRNIYVPIRAVLALYARENNKGMFFDPAQEEPEPPDDQQPPDPEIKSAPTRPALRIVK